MKLTLLFIGLSGFVLLFHGGWARPTDSPSTTEGSQNQDVAYLENMVNKLKKKIALLEQQISNAEYDPQSNETTNSSDETVEVIVEVEVIAFVVENATNATASPESSMSTTAVPATTTNLNRRRRGVSTMAMPAKNTTASNPASTTECDHDEEDEKRSTTAVPATTTNHSRRRRGASTMAIPAKNITASNPASTTESEHDEDEKDEDEKRSTTAVPTSTEGISTSTKTLT